MNSIDPTRAGGSTHSILSIDSIRSISLESVVFLIAAIGLAIGV